MWNKLKSNYVRIAHGEPGRRFMDYYRYRQRTERGTRWKTPLYLALGVVLIMAGTFLSIPPGVPGFLLTIPGLALIAARVEMVARILDRGERWLRRVLNRAR